MLHTRVLTFLQVTLGVVFFWFGILKIFNVSPVHDIIALSLPMIFSISKAMFLLLGVVEVLIGIALLAKKFVRFACIAVIIHLIIASSAVLITQGFKPYFPVLTLEGEFVIKNLVLIASAVVILTEHKPAQKE